MTAVASIVAAAAMAAPAVTRVSVSGDREQIHAGGQLGAMTPDGRFFVFTSRTRALAPGDGPGLDSFLRDRRRGTTILITARNRRWSSEPGLHIDGGFGFSLSSDARYVAFSSYADDLEPGDTNVAYDTFIRDMQRRTTERLPLAQGPSLSSDGRYVAFVAPSTAATCPCDVPHHWRAVQSSRTHRTLDDCDFVARTPRTRTSATKCTLASLPSRS